MQEAADDDNADASGQEGGGAADAPDAAIAAADVSISGSDAAAAAAAEEQAASDAALGIIHDTSPDEHELPLAAQAAAAAAAPPPASAAAAAAPPHDQPASHTAVSEVPLPSLNQARTPQIVTISHLVSISPPNCHNFSYRFHLTPKVLHFLPHLRPRCSPPALICPKRLLISNHVSNHYGSPPLPSLESVSIYNCFPVSSVIRPCREDLFLPVDERATIRMMCVNAAVF
jgi:hypothetical protein